MVPLVLLDGSQELVENRVVVVLHSVRAEGGGETAGVPLVRLLPLLALLGQVHDGGEALFFCKDLSEEHLGTLFKSEDVGGCLKLLQQVVLDIFIHREHSHVSMAKLVERARGQERLHVCLESP